MGSNRHFDIAIIGTGITGLSAAYHLNRLGTKNIVFFNESNMTSASEKSAGFVTAGLMDNITRIAHRHGQQVAQDVWEWSTLAFDRFLDFCSANSIPYVTGERYRWIVSSAELKEAETAIRILNSLGFNSGLREIRAPDYPAKTIAIQNEGNRAAFIDTTFCLNSLREACRNVPVLKKANSLREDRDKIWIESEDGEYSSEGVILASHLAISNLVPPLSSSIVSYADQWHEFRVQGDLGSVGLKNGSFFSWHHAHYWGGCLNNSTIRLGGARFLRKLAGFEAQEATVSPLVEQNIICSWNELFPMNSIIETIGTVAGLDCWPSDELPLVGPIFGQPRLLVATGYMGLGMAAGFYAGQCIAELLAGLRPPLPRKLWPERLRNLPD